MDNFMAESDNDEDSELNIARRTRSHRRIDFVPNDNLDFPDVDMNLYQNADSSDDPEYRKFLNQTYSEELGGDTNTDDNDPEYVYNDDIFSHGWRFDLNEFSKLNQSSFNRFTDTRETSKDGASDTQRPKDQSTLAILPSTIQLKCPIKQNRRKLDMFEDPEFARVLNQQLRQHIQLLTQTILLTRTTTNMKSESDEAKSHLNSYMKIFGNKSKPSNLLPALELINNFDTPKDLKSSIRLSWRPLPIPESVKSAIRSNPSIFMYPSLRPKVAFSFLPEKLIPKKPKINFTINEDKLLAYALNEFKGESAPYAFIASLLMTTKTKTQISNHIKNIKRSPGNENNPIRLYYSNGELPDIDLDGDSQFVLPETEDTLEAIDNTSDKDTETPSKPPASPEVCDIKLADQVPKMADSNGNHIDGFNNFGWQQKHEDEVEIKHDESKQTHDDMNHIFIRQDPDDLMNMDLDDLMAASTTISKSLILNNSDSNNNNKNIKNLRLKKSMLSLMSHTFSLDEDMGDIIVDEFLKSSSEKLGERNYIQLLQLLANLNKPGDNSDERVVKTYKDIIDFLVSIDAPMDIKDRIVLFLNLNQATKCGCAFEYLHWMRFFEFLRHVEMYHDGVEGFEKKLTRLLDALQRDDPHKVKLAIANMINKNPLLKREYDALSLGEKPHPSLFICDEDFDDITEAFSMIDSSTKEDKSCIYSHEHFYCKPTREEINYATQACPCKCHPELKKMDTSGRDMGCKEKSQSLSQHCDKCNLKFMKGRMYLVNKIKPILAEWAHAPLATQLAGPELSPHKSAASQGIVAVGTATATATTNAYHDISAQVQNGTPKWTFEEDREILEFCRLKAEQNEETISFDTSTFEELITKQRSMDNGGREGACCKKSAREIAERFNQLMDLYKDENSTVG